MNKVLKLKNIGKLSEAEIYLEGITVVCGENNSGKSTIGKALYNIFYSFFNSEEKADNQKNDKIGKEFDEIHKQLMFTFKKFTPSNEMFSEKYFSTIKKNFKARLKRCDSSNIEKVFDEYFENCINLFKINYIKENRNFCEFDGLKATFKTILVNLYKIPTEDIVKDIVSVQTEKIFHGQITKISCEESCVEFYDDIKGKLSMNYSSNDKCIEAIQEFIVNNDSIPIYIENPRIIDLLSNSIIKSKEFIKMILSPSNSYNDIYGQLLSGNFAASLNKSLKKWTKNSQSDDSRMDIIQTEKKVIEMIKELNKLLNGKFIANDYTIRFKDNDIATALDVRNLSTGAKSMAVIERCLSLGIIKEGSILILDEPEIHLHPEWQLKYAEFIIILQKALNLTILITTHSPQFLRAIECYMDKYEVMDRLNVYSIENGSITNASYSEYGISEIYDKLSKPYDELQQMLDEKYGEYNE